ncbi:MAG: hypothetical protein V1895_01290 [Parcubacteria group bacterium]
MPHLKGEPVHKKASPTRFAKVFSRVLLDSELFSIVEWARYIGCSVKEIQSWMDGKSFPSAAILHTVIETLSRKSDASPKRARVLEEFKQLMPLPLRDLVDETALPWRELRISMGCYTLQAYYLKRNIENLLATAFAVIPTEEQMMVLEELKLQLKRRLSSGQKK